jgi:hypothetical protein
MIFKMEKDYGLFILSSLIASAFFIGAIVAIICLLQLRGEIHLSQTWIEKNISNPALLAQDGWIYYSITNFFMAIAMGYRA